MFDSCTKKYTDESDEYIFRFTFYCDVCGEPFKPEPVRFSGSSPPDTHDGEKHWRLLWKREHERAFGRADFKVKHQFYECPGCGLFVCDKCTVSKQDNNGDARRERCVSCENKVRQGGNRPHLKYVYEPKQDLQDKKAISARLRQKKVKAKVKVKKKAGWNPWMKAGFRA